MKIFNKLFVVLALGTMAFSACQKADPLTVFADGVAPVLSASATTIAPAPSDSDRVALILNWSDPKYAQDSAKFKFVIELDSTNRNFSKAAAFVVTGARSRSFLAKELNTIFLDWGFVFNRSYEIDVRVTSSYGNNNEQKRSNVLKLRVTPYKIPPKVALPTTLRLFIVGDAFTDAGWNDNGGVINPVRELTRTDETTWAGIFRYNGSGNYKVWETWGAWGTQFRYLSGDAFSGTFEKRDADPGWPSPTASGSYRFTMDFQQGRYSVVPVANAVPTQLWITGDATTTGWTNNPVSNPAQRFTHLSSGLFEITIAFVPGRFYKFLSSPGNWQPQFGGSSATGEAIGANYGGGSDPAAIPTPATAGNYKITVNFITNTYTIVRVN